MAVWIAGFSLTPYPAVAQQFTLKVSAEHVTGYERSLFKLWIDANGNGCNTRAEVLIQEAIEKPKKSAGCKLSQGKWMSYYDEKTYLNPSSLDIDHLVPLYEAWRSGAWNWTPEQRTAYANDLTEKSTLVAVTASLNRSKGDKDIANWVPPKNKCKYLIDWLTVKAKYNLTVDPDEKIAINVLSKSCNGATVLFRQDSTEASSPVASASATPTQAQPSESVAPEMATWPENSSAKCKDGSYSYSVHRSGTCSGHGGVAQWRSP